MKHKQFNELIPINERTYNVFKEQFGPEVLAFFYRIFESDIPLRKKKRMFYDSYPAFSEKRKDIIWENYIDLNILEIKKYNKKNKEQE